MSDTKKVVCPSCAALNRIPLARMSDQPVCGKCKQVLLPTRPIELDDRSFKGYVSRTDVPVVVDFWAPWCGPCKMMAPAFAQAAAGLAPHAVLAKLNTETAPQTAAALHITSIPTMIVFRGGHELARQSGAMSATQISQWVRQSVASR